MSRLPEILLKHHLISDEQLRFAAREQQKSGSRLLAVLVRGQLVDEAAVADRLAALGSLTRLDLNKLTLDAEARRYATADWAFDHGTLPMFVDSAGRKLVVATSDPTDVQPIDDLSFKCGLSVTMVVGSETEIMMLIRHAYFGDKLEFGKSVPAQLLDEAELEITRGIDEERNALHHQGPSPRAPSRPPQPPPRVSSAPRQGGDPLRAALQRLAANQEAAAMELQALFELCVQKGLLRKDEYLARLASRPD